MTVAIIIPTFNEALNIENLVTQITAISEGYHMMIIDDNSTDGTQDIIKRLSKTHNLSSHVRTSDRGYGSALKFGLEKGKNFDIVVTMDADLSHDPQRIPALINEISEGRDISIGSRYVPGGQIPQWSLFRRITSKLTNWFVSYALHLPIKDNTSGYRAYSGHLLCKILDQINSKGYYILEEILYVSSKEGAVISEVDIIFNDRIDGESKAKVIKEAWGLLKLVYVLRRDDIISFANFILVGFSGIFINEGLLFIFTEFFSFYFLVSSIIAIELSIIWNFILNDLWTFRDTKSGNWFFRLIKFNVARSFTVAINLVILAMLTYVGMHYLLANLIGITVATFAGINSQ